MDIRRLKYFAAVADLGSFTKAAEHLNVAQSALSRQIQQLEAEVGLELLARMGRHVRLTDAGQSLLNHARTIERDFERLLEDMLARRGTPKGKVVFGIPPTLAETLVLPVVARIRAEFPHITLKIVEGLTPVLSEWVQGNKVDLAILSLGLVQNPDELAALDIEQVALEEMVVVEPRSEARPAPAYYELDALRDRPLVVTRMLEEIVRDQLGLADLSLNVELEIDSVQAIKLMVAAGDAASLLPISMLSAELEQGTVVASAITAGGVRRALMLAHHKHRQMTRAFDAVSGVVKEEVRRLLEAGSFSLGGARSS